MSQIYPWAGQRGHPGPVSVGISEPVSMGIPGTDRMIVPEVVPAGFPGPVTIHVVCIKPLLFVHWF